MSEFNDPSNLSRLPRSRATSEWPAPDDEARVRDQVSRLLAEAEPVAEPEPERMQSEPQWLPASQLPQSFLPPEIGPEPGHRNAVVCPQCDRWTWRATQECRRCGYDLFAHAERLAWERRQQWLAWRRQRLSYWASGFGLGGLAALLLSTKVPAGLTTILMVAGFFALAVAFICGKLLKRLEN